MKKLEKAFHIATIIIGVTLAVLFILSYTQQ